MGVLNYVLPTVVPISWRVVAELYSSVTTNVPVSGVIYLGIGSTGLTPQNVTSTFSSYQTNYVAGPTITNPSCVADGIFTFSSPIVQSNSTGGPIIYIGTFNPGNNLGFSVLATSTVPTTTFYISGVLKLTMYPLWNN